MQERKPESPPKHPIIKKSTSPSKGLAHHSRVPHGLPANQPQDLVGQIRASIFSGPFKMSLMKRGLNMYPP